jgi:phytoene synthase
MDELTAAGILEPELRASYLECKRLNSHHGKTYYLATLLLPKEKRPHVHALYGFARFADEIVDDLASSLSPEEKREALEKWSAQMLQDIKTGNSTDPIGRALVHTVQEFQIPIEYFEAFLRSMAMDLTVTSYQTYEDLEKYMYGSAAVIGLQMVHVLGTVPGKKSDALVAAEKLGNAFQLANFIRDVGEDLERGRIYLPLAELAECGVTPENLREGVVTPNIKAALQFQIARVRRLKSEADQGIPLLPPQVRPCIRAASELYCGIVDEVEKVNFDVFKFRAKTSNLRRLATVVKALLYRD